MQDMIKTIQKLLEEQTNDIKEYIDVRLIPIEKDIKALKVATIELLNEYNTHRHIVEGNITTGNPIKEEAV